MDANELRRLFRYDAETGQFTRLVTSSHNAKAGQIAGCRNRSGYLVIRIDDRLYYAHRLAWLYVYGEWPQNDTDHINGDKSDNRLSNLRPATRSQNCINKPETKRNTSGVCGVGRFKDKWRAYIHVDGRYISLGHYESKDQAVSARRDAERQYYGEFGRA
jgi:hypothetical protein